MYHDFFFKGGGGYDLKIETEFGIADIIIVE